MDNLPTRLREAAERASTDLTTGELEDLLCECHGAGVIMPCVYVDRGLASGIADMLWDLATRVEIEEAAE